MIEISHVPQLAPGTAHVRHALHAEGIEVVASASDCRGKEKFVCLRRGFLPFFGSLLISKSEYYSSFPAVRASFLNLSVAILNTRTSRMLDFRSH